MVDHERFKEVLSKLAQTLITEYAIADVLYELCDDIVDLLPVRGAGVMLADRDDVLRFAAASDERVAQIEALQERFDEGPCLDAYRKERDVEVADLATDEAYPKFSPGAVEHEMRSVRAFPMKVHGHLIGALSVYGDEADDLDDDDRAATTLAAAATAYVINHRAYDEVAELAGQLQGALDSRIVIEQAKGKLSEQLGIDVSEAFVRLRAHARDHRARLHDVAQQVVDGDLTFE